MGRTHRIGLGVGVRLGGGVAGRAAAAVVLLAAASGLVNAEKVLKLPIRTDGPKSLDPVEGSTVYDNIAASQVYETLLVNKYSNPMEKEPLLLAEMPERLDGGKRFRFVLKDGVTFHDDEAFPGGEGREITTDDVFYSLKRLADPEYNYENYWLIENTIVGFDGFRDAQKERVDAGEAFDYDAAVEGFIKIDDKRFEIVLEEPVTKFLWVLSMFQTSIVPREAVEFYGDDFAFNPVGTGPFMLLDEDNWVPKQKLIVHRNPEYHDVRYPARGEWTRDDRRLQLHRPAGRRAPFVDVIEFTMFPEDQPMWLEFNAGNLGYIQVPDQYFEQAFDEQTKEVLPEVEGRGITAHANKLLDFIFRGFNMSDEVLGHPAGERGKLVRQAISLAVDIDEVNQTFYSGTNTVYDGPIPPGLPGHPEGGRVENSFRGPNLELARQKLEQAGYPGGEGLPPLKYYLTQNALNQQMAEMLTRHLARVGVQVSVNLVDFSTLIETVNKKNAQMFSFAWSSDYPDAENNLALFFGPNEAPGANHYNYKNPEYDALYREIVSMPEGSERTAKLERMRDMVIADVPYIGSMARERRYLVNPWLLNCRPTERYYSWYKFLDVDEDQIDW